MGIELSMGIMLVNIDHGNSYYSMSIIYRVKLVLFLYQRYCKWDYNVKPYL